MPKKLSAGAFFSNQVVPDFPHAPVPVLMHVASQPWGTSVYADLLIDDADFDGVLDSTNQEVEATLTGLTVDQVMLEGSDELNLFLKGKAFRDLLKSLADDGLLG